MCVGFSESLRICLQSSYSRLCGGYRRLPTDRQGSGQVPLLFSPAVAATGPSAEDIEAEDEEDDDSEHGFICFMNYHSPSSS